MDKANLRKVLRQGANAFSRKVISEPEIGCTIASIEAALKAFRRERRREYWRKVWVKSRQLKIFPIRYKCTTCSGHHTITAKRAVILCIIYAGIIALLVLKLTGRVG